MALTVQKRTPSSANNPNLKIAAYVISFDTSYTTNGLAWDLSADFDVVYAAVFEHQGGRVFELTSKNAPASSKVKAYQQKDPAAAGGADIALPEVANATDLSALSNVGVVVYGRKS
jgi:hypothetical protein